MKVAGMMMAFGVLAVATPAYATETVTYTYDARGRLVKVVRSGTVNNGVQTEYTHDKADNRTKVKTTGASN
ncbi:RHS repeat domain-containing protein [Tsuneonella suprasediminis]|uniref:RHS repeat domain-containing protein n=1 Tax=Tsuneonella suprasediminis TaxID=2306996 RepID=UPI002F93F0BC